MIDAEIIALAWRYYKTGKASTAEADGIPTLDEVVANRLVLAIRIGQLTRKGKPTGTGRLRTVARAIGKGQAVDNEVQPVLPLTIDNKLRPIGLDFVIENVTRLLAGDRIRASELTEQAFAKGFKGRYVITTGWSTRVLTEEERHFITLYTTKPTSVDDGGVRKARQRATEWLRKQGRVIQGQ